LKERRQILIHRAVTKGIKHDVEMKDSGVEWIGEIPGHWEVKKLKYILKERNERSITGDEPLLMMSQIHGLVVRGDFHEKAEVAQSSVGNKMVYKDDLVFNKLKAHLGVFFKSNIPFKGIVSPDYAVYYSNGLIEDLKYLELLFRSPSYIREFICRATGIVEGLIRLYTGDLFDIEVPLPPRNEQIKILEYIENLSQKIATAISLKEQEIEKMKEYKSVLINGVVTGKVRVG
jgi:type I restriction enzyme, S subunit